jgi:hypothetical protein
VDTPGLGALALAGAAETLAYLPQCDLGIVLISAVNPIDDEDLSTIHALSLAGIPVMVLLSKPSARLRWSNWDVSAEVCPAGWWPSWKCETRAEASRTVWGWR